MFIKFDSWMYDLLCQMWLITNPKFGVFDEHVHKHRVRGCVCFVCFSD